MKEVARAPWSTRLGVAAIAAVSCGRGGERTASDRADASAPAPALIAESSGARDRLSNLRLRFGVDVTPLSARASSHPLVEQRPVIGPGVATFEAAGSSDLQAVVNRRGVLRPASVVLPARANGSVQLREDAGGMGIRFRMRGASDAPAAVAEGTVLYGGAYDGSDVVHRAYSEGTEDFVVFERRPAREQLAYEVDVSEVPGLRAVGGAVEFLDETGTPCLRIAPPSVTDASGHSHAAALSVVGCGFDADPRAPWGRPVTRPGASSCGVVVAWTDVSYPAVVDPTWSATGSMEVARVDHTATLLLSTVLVAGGDNLSSAELYDPASGTFAATGSMSIARAGHSATYDGGFDVLVAGGCSGSPVTCTATTEVYSETNGTFSASGSMATARAGHTASFFQSSGQAFASAHVLIAGGSPDDGTTSLQTAELYTWNAGTFASAGMMTTARQDATASVLLVSGSMATQALIAGGNADGSTSLATAEIYTLNTGFAATGSMSTARQLATATVLGSHKILVAGGSEWLQLDGQRGAVRPFLRDLHTDRVAAHLAGRAFGDPPPIRQGALHRRVGSPTTSSSPRSRAPSCSTP